MITGTLGIQYFCELCNIGYIFKDKHRCKASCQCCQATPYDKTVKKYYVIISVSLEVKLVSIAINTLFMIKFTVVKNVIIVI